MDTMNSNTNRFYRDILPQINSEFEESQVSLKQKVKNALKSINSNLSLINIPNKTPWLHRININKPKINYDKIIRNKKMKKTPLAPVKSYKLFKNTMIASPMCLNETMQEIAEYVDEEQEKREYDETVSVQIKMKQYKEANIKNAEQRINDELILSFFNNRYYHLGDILFEIPSLYTAFDEYLSVKLSSENLHFLREVHDLYFDLSQSWNHNFAVRQTRKIYKKFIADSAKQQINLSGNVTKKMHNDLRKINKFKDPLKIFDRAYDQISQLLHKESLPNFYKSQQFKSWYDKEREKKLKNNEWFECV